MIWPAEEVHGVPLHPGTIGNLFRAEFCLYALLPFKAVSMGSMFLASPFVPDLPCLSFRLHGFAAFCDAEGAGPTIPLLGDHVLHSGVLLLILCGRLQELLP